ncbi:MAG: hypothetical protein ACI974_001565, partial [Paraglaciecola sp.]
NLKRSPKQILIKSQRQLRTSLGGVRKKTEHSDSFRANLNLIEKD